MATYRRSVDATIQQIAATSALDLVPGEAPLVLSLAKTAKMTVRRTSGLEAGNGLSVYDGQFDAGVNAQGAIDLLQGSGGDTGDFAIDLRLVQWQVSPQTPADMLVS